MTTSFFVLFFNDGNEMLKIKYIPFKKSDICEADDFLNILQMCVYFAVR